MNKERKKEKNDIKMGEKKMMWRNKEILIWVNFPSQL
jgi:hypothetical protein